jgi:hypothetical protein
VSATTCSRLHVGDVVRSRDRTDQRLGRRPGKVVRLYNGLALVEVTVGRGHKDPSYTPLGEAFYYTEEALEVVR